jgi:hypothetical protein
VDILGPGLPPHASPDVASWPNPRGRGRIHHRGTAGHAPGPTPPPHRRPQARPNDGSHHLAHATRLTTIKPDAPCLTTCPEWMNRRYHTEQIPAHLTMDLPHESSEALDAFDGERCVIRVVDVERDCRLNHRVPDVGCRNHPCRRVDWRCSARQCSQSVCDRFVVTAASGTSRVEKQTACVDEVLECRGVRLDPRTSPEHAVTASPAASLMYGRGDGGHSTTTQRADDRRRQRLQPLDSRRCEFHASPTTIGNDVPSDGIAGFGVPRILMTEYRAAVGAIGCGGGRRG